MRLPAKFLHFAYLGLRSSTLFLRFLLSFYVIRYLGYEAAGVYGLTVGIIGLMPAAIGWGLNYFVAREVVGHNPADVVGRVRDRLFVTLVSLTTATLLVLSAMPFFGYGFSYLYLYVIALVWLETFGLDVSLPLIGLEKAIEVNVLVFLRSGLWVPFVIALGLLFPQYRTIDVVLVGWIAANLMSWSLFFYIARDWRLRKGFSTPIDFAWIRNRLGRSWYIYLSDLGIVGLIYIDRYIVSFMLGLTATGIYTFFWSLSNALQTLVATVVVQIALPVLVKTFPIGDRSAWRAALLRELTKTIVFSTGLAVIIFVASELLLGYLSMQGLREHRGLLLLMLAASVLRSCSDLANIGITSTGRDRFYASINISGVFLSVALSFISIYTFGLIGAGIGSVVTAIILLSARFYFLNRTFKASKIPAAPISRAD
jgi:O-antigen/teichoic acid export membrane protein